MIAIQKLSQNQAGVNSAPPNIYFQNTLYKRSRIAENLKVKLSRRFMYYVFIRAILGSMACLFAVQTLNAQFINPDENAKPVEVKTEPAKTPVSKTENISGKIVRNIKAELVAPDKAQIKITWSPASDVKDDFIIARANYPISSGDLLLSAKSVAVLPPGISSYTDTAPENGAWYYAIVARGMVADRKMMLMAAENYTGTPVDVNVVSRSSENTPPQVTLIYAQYNSENNIVRVSWKGVSTPDIAYVVYRSIEPLGTAGAIDRALRIGLLRNGAEFFEDRNLPGPGQYYYGVTTRSATGAEDVKLIPDQSYTREPVKIGTSEIPTAVKISAEAEKDPHNIVVKWIEPETAESAVYSYILYRSTSPITGEKDILGAERLAEIKAGTGLFRDKLVNPGKYYYALVTKDSKGRNSNRFTLNSNVSEKPAILEAAVAKKEISEQPIDYSAEQLFNGLQIYTREKSVVISWQNRTDIPKGSRTHIYRFVQKPEKLPDIIRGTLVAKVGPDVTMHEDAPAESGVYYYALLLETGKGLKPEGFFRNHNLTGPVSVTGHKQAEEVEENEEPEEEPEEEIEPVVKPVTPREIAGLNKVIRTTYLTGDYALAVHKLLPFTRHRDKKIRSKAIFYTGLSYYHAGNYEKALPCFLNKDVTTVYHKNARFWYRRTVEKVR